MALLIIFILGVANFAMHKAVLESRHPLLRDFGWFYQMLGGRFSLGVEFLMLLGAMLLAVEGARTWAWIYVAYSLINGFGAWLILNRRI